MAVDLCVTAVDLYLDGGSGKVRLLTWGRYDK